jgi:hypothetical protein
MKRLLDFDPISHEAVTFIDNNDGTFSLRHEQPVEAILDRNKAIANDEDFTKKGIKEDYWKYATIPNIVAYKWKKELGVDIFNRDHKKKMFQLINSPEYRYLKTTSKTHAPR